MTTLATLTIDLAGNSAKLQNELKKANKSTKNWAEKTRNQVNGVGKLMAGVAVAGGAALTAIYVNAAKEADELAKTSDKLGILPEKLTAIQYAGELTGVSISTTNKAMQNMVKTVGEASAGVGLGVRAFEQLGISVEDIAKQSPDEQFKTIATAMKGMESQTDKLTVSTQLFGTRGAGLINTLALGADGLTEMEEEAKALGITLNRMDLAKIESANDAFFKAGLVTSAFGKSLAAEVSPFVEALSNHFVEAAKEAGGFGQAVNSGLLGVVSAVGFVADAVNGLSTVWTAVKGTAALAISSKISGLAFLDRAITSLINNIPGLSATTNKTLQTMAGSFKQIAFDIKDEFNDAITAPPPSEKIKKWVEDVQQKAEKAAKEVASNRKSVIAPPTSVIPDTGVLEKEAKDRAEAAKKFAETALGEFGIPDTIGEEIERVNKSFEAKREAILANTAITEEMRTDLEVELTEQRNQKIALLEAQRADAALTAGASMFSSLAGLSKAFGGEQSKTYRRMFALSQGFSLAQAAVSMYTGISKGVALGWPAMIPAIAAASAQGLSAISGIKGQSFAGTFDTGGNIPAGQFGIAGEYGPEFIQGPAQITSRKDTMNKINSLGDSTPTVVTVNFNIDAIDTEGAAEVINDQRGQIVSIIRSAFHEAGETVAI